MVVDGEEKKCECGMNSAAGASTSASISTIASSTSIRTSASTSTSTSPCNNCAFPSHLLPLQGTNTHSRGVPN